MKRLKTFAKYIICLVLFYIFSHVMIFIGLNTEYNSIKLQNNLPVGGITIKSAQATSVNGEVKGSVSEEFSSKYLKFNFYTDLNTLAGSYCVAPSDMQNNNFALYFKLNHVDSYTVEVTDENPQVEYSDNFSSTEFDSQILFAALLSLLFI